MHEELSRVEKNPSEDDLNAVRESALESLPEDIRSGIQRLESKVPESAILAFINEMLEKNPEKIIDLDHRLNMEGDGIESLGVIEGADKQTQAVKCLEILLNPYYGKKEKEGALNGIEGLLN